jgi:arsenite methyltransferase
LNLIDGVLRPGGLKLTRRIVDFCCFESDETILDLGCGIGTTVEFLTDAFGINTVGVDLSEEAIEKGKQSNPKLQLIRASGENLPFADAAVNGVVTECSLSVMGYDGRVLTEINRILPLGGKLAITDLYFRSGYIENTTVYQENGQSCVKGAKSREELTVILETSGFRLMLWEDHSQSLKDFAIRYIMEYGSLDDFWKCTNTSLDQETNNKAMKKAVGYFLLVAQKTKNIGTHGNHENFGG